VLNKKPAQPTVKQGAVAITCLPQTLKNTPCLLILVHLLRVEVNFISRTLANIGFILALIGSLFLIIIGIAGILGIFVLIFAPFFALGSFFYGIVMLIVGYLGCIFKICV
jgi:hypothetical protein